MRGAGERLSVTPGAVWGRPRGVWGNLKGQSPAGRAAWGAGLAWGAGARGFRLCGPRLAGARSGPPDSARFSMRAPRGHCWGEPEQPRGSGAEPLRPPGRARPRERLLRAGREPQAPSRGVLCPVGPLAPPTLAPAVREPPTAPVAGPGGRCEGV